MWRFAPAEFVAETPAIVAPHLLLVPRPGNDGRKAASRTEDGSPKTGLSWGKLSLGELPPGDTFPWETGGLGVFTQLK